MTKSELIAALAASHKQLAASDIDLAVKTILDTMVESLAKGQRIEIRGFGSFSLSQRAPRIGRNPKTGEQVSVPGKRVPHFKAGKELRERVDNGQGSPGASKSSSTAPTLDDVESSEQIDPFD